MGLKNTSHLVSVADTWQTVYTAPAASSVRIEEILLSAAARGDVGQAAVASLRFVDVSATPDVNVPILTDRPVTPGSFLPIGHSVFLEAGDKLDAKCSVANALYVAAAVNEGTVDSFIMAQVVLNAAAGADLETIIGVAPFAGVVTGAHYVADTLLTGANTDSRTLSIFNAGQAGAGTTEIASKAFTLGVDAVKYDATAITLSATAANLVVAAGDVLVFKSLHIGGTGLADPGGTVQIEIARS